MLYLKGKALKVNCRVNTGPFGKPTPVLFAKKLLYEEADGFAVDDADVTLVAFLNFKWI